MNIFDCKNQIIKFMKQWRNQEEEDHQVTEQDSKQVERLRSKYLYKIFLIVLKYTPLIILINEILYTTTAYFGITWVWLNYFGGFSLCNVIYLYIASYVFKFCTLYRISITSTVAVNLLAIYDTHIGIPLDDLLMLRLYLIILLIGLISYLKFHVKNNRKSMLKISG